MKLNIYRFLLGSIFVFTVLLPSFVHAQSEACDPEFNNVITAHAEMTAMREMETAQRLILKPDSVLQYSCFPEHIAAHLALTSFVSPERAAYIASVSAPYDIYIEENYEHMPGGNVPLNEAIPFSTCYSMAVVWDQMKCRNFDKEDFWNFIVDAVPEDRRIFPEPCEGEAVEIRNQRWADNIEIANPPPVYPAAAGAIERSPDDDYYLDLISWTDGTCAAALPTGVLFMNGDEDAVCPLPGCTHNGNLGCF